MFRSTRTASEGTRPTRGATSIVSAISGASTSPIPTMPGSADPRGTSVDVRSDAPGRLQAGDAQYADPRGQSSGLTSSGADPGATDGYAASGISGGQIGMTDPAGSGAVSDQQRVAWMDQVVAQAIALVLGDPAEAVSRLGRTGTGDAQTGQRMLSSGSMVSGSSPQYQEAVATGTGQQLGAGSVSDVAPGLPGSVVNGDQLVNATRTMSPYVGPAAHLATSALTGGGPNDGAQVSEPASRFLTALSKTDLTQVGGQINEIASAWQQLSPQDRAVAGPIAVQEILEPAAQQIQQAAGARSHPGTSDTAGVQQAQQALAGMQQLASMLSGA